MKLSTKKNGKGYDTSVVLSFGSKEARELNLFDENGNLKNVKSAKSIDTNTIKIFLENS